MDASSNHSRRSNRSSRSERNTRSTLSATLSVRSVQSSRTSSTTTRRRNLRKTQSDDALTGYSNGAGCDANRRLQLRKSRSVQFACDKDGRIQHEEQIIKRTKDKSLWWNKDEIEDIRDTCWVIVDNVKSAGMGTTPITDKETRGLERYLIPRRVVTVQEHRRLVLEAHRGFAEDEDQATISKKAAKKVSREAQKVAFLTAKLDTREALRAALT